MVICSAITTLITSKLLTTQAQIPADIEIRPVTIMSDGTKMAGDVYLPKNRKPGDKLPAIIMCAGTGGTKKGLPRRWAPILAREGFAVLGFDYRGWGESDPLLMLVGDVPKPDEKGEATAKVKLIRWQMNLMDQTFDVRSAISYMQAQPEVDPNRIGLLGSSYGGGVVTLMSAIDSRVKCTAAQVGGLGIGRDKLGFDLMMKQATGQTEPIPFKTGTLGGKLSNYDQMRANPAKSVGYGDKYDLVGRIRIPMIFIDAENEELGNPKENGERFAKILKDNKVPVEYHVIKGISHYGIYREGFQEATQLELSWFKKHLKGER
jgi:dienelactone hydrolase